MNIQDEMNRIFKVQQDNLANERKFKEFADAERKTSKCKKCGEIDSITYEDENNNIINPKCINCWLEENAK